MGSRRCALRIPDTPGAMIEQVSVSDGLAAISQEQY